MLEGLTGIERLIFESTGSLPRLLIVISGPSGAGKNTIIKKLLAKYPMIMDRVRTYTTRPPREDEIEGEQYFFVSAELFDQMAQAGRLMESTQGTAGHDVYRLGKRYSMPSDLFEGLPIHKHLVLAEVDVHGAQLLRQKRPADVPLVTIFVTAAPADLAERISERPDENMRSSELTQRLQIAREQVEAADTFDYVVINEEDQLEKTVVAVEAILWAERSRVRPGFTISRALAASPIETARPD